MIVAYHEWGSPDVDLNQVVLCVELLLSGFIAIPLIMLRDRATAHAAWGFRTCPKDRQKYRQMFPAHSHSIILGHGNALIFQRNFFLRAMKNRLPDPSKICALEFKGEFRRFGICSVSATIDINRSIFLWQPSADRQAADYKKTVTTLSSLDMPIRDRQRRLDFNLVASTPLLPRRCPSAASADCLADGTLNSAIEAFCN